MDYNHYKLHSSLDYISLLVILTFLSGITFVSAVYGQENIVFPADSGIINVRDYGAVGDGVTDDTQAIRNAMAARTQGVDVLVYFPNGTYKVRDTLAWSNPFERYCTLQGRVKMERSSSSKTIPSTFKMRIIPVLWSRRSTGITFPCKVSATIFGI